MKVPNELCEECGKTITRKAIANFWAGRIVCTSCWRKLNSAERAREEQARQAAEPATEPQLRYARDLGISFPHDATKRIMMALISEHLDRPGPPELQAEAVAYGIPEATSMPGRKLQEKLNDRKAVVGWVYSVCRHMLHAPWLSIRDSRIPLSAMLPIVAEVVSRPEAMEALADQNEGEPDDAFENACDDRGIDPSGQGWTFFGIHGANSRSWIYKFTKGLIEQHLAHCRVQ